MKQYVSIILILSFALSASSAEEQAGTPEARADEISIPALVAEFGLENRVVDEHASGELARRNRRAALKAAAGFVLIVAVFVLAMYLRYHG